MFYPCSLLFVHNGGEDQRTPAADQSTPAAAAVVATPPKDTASEISSTNTKLAIALPLVLIGRNSGDVFSLAEQIPIAWVINCGSAATGYSIKLYCRHF